MWVTKLLISPVKKKDFLPKTDQIWPKIGIFGQFGPGHAGIFGALLVGRLSVVARGLYLARHLFTLSTCSFSLLKVIEDRDRAFSRSGCQTEIISLGKWGRPMALLPPAHFSHQYNRSFRLGLVRTFQDSSIWLNKSKILGTGFNIIFRN